MDDRAFDDSLVPAADRADQLRPVAPEPERGGPPSRPDVPEADALDQADEVEPGPRRVAVTTSFEAPEADALDQAIEVPLDDDAL